MSEWLNVIQTTFRGYRVRPTSITEDGTLALLTERDPAKLHAIGCAQGWTEMCEATGA